jgi:hypothetical protein
MPASTLPTATRAGTPCADSWDKKWIAEVERREAQHGRRICGARTVGDTPCLLPSDHDSGRCPHHGGAPLTGAPEGNRNAVIHHLYSRRLMICGTHCAAWHSCPFGGGASTISLGKEKVEPKETDMFLGTRMEIRERGGEEPKTDAEGGLGFQPERELQGASSRANTLGQDARATQRPIKRFPKPDSEEGRKLAAEYKRLGVIHEPGVNYEEELAAAGSTLFARASDASRESGDGASHLQGRAAPATKEVSYGDYLKSLPPSERPLCPLEQSEYNEVVTDVQFRTGARSHNALGRHLAHHVALLTVMVSRASRALNMKPITEKVEHSGDTFFMTSEKPAAALVALEKLSRELRMWMRHIEQSCSIYTDPDRNARKERAHRIQRDTSPDPAVANEYETDDGQPVCDEIDNDNLIGFDKGTWDLVDGQQNLIEDLYRRLREASDGSGVQPERDRGPP